MVSALYELELHHIDQLGRQELIEAIRENRGGLQPDLLTRLEEESTEHLQLLLLAARLICVLRQVCERG